MMENFELAPDLVLVGHFHRLDSIFLPKLTHSLGVSVKHIGFTGCYYRTYMEGKPNYASDKWYSPSIIGYLEAHLSKEGIRMEPVPYLKP